MKKNRTWQHLDKLTRDLIAFCIVCGVTSIGALIYLSLFLPGEGDGIFSISAARASLLAVLVSLIAAIIFLGVSTWNQGRISGHLSSLINSGRFTVVTTIAALAAFMGTASVMILLSLYQGSNEYRYFAYSQRLLPFSFLGVVIFIGIALINLRNKTGNLSIDKSAIRDSFWIGIITWMIFGLMWLFASLTGVGLIPDSIGWEAPTVPVLEWQILLAWLIAGLYFILRAIIPDKYQSYIFKDIVIAVIIWFAAVFVWGSQPVPDGFFAIRRAPNYEPYPFSDAQFYDVFAQNILVGNGFKGNEIPPRPLYILLLSIFHLIAGQSYPLVIFVQTLFLALLPVGLYCLAKELHSRAAGLFVATVAILRELTSIRSTSFTDNISNSKLLFADLPTTLAIIWMAWVVVIWLKSAPKKPWLALVAGGMVGICLLFRTQTVFFIPAIFIFAFVRIKDWRQLLIQGALLFTGLLLTVSPWLLRNHGITGQFVFDHAESQTRVMAMRYLPGHDSPNQLPGESEAEYNNRLFGLILQTIKDDPLYVAEFVTSHWINSQIGNVLVLPVREGLTSIKEIWSPSYAFWQEWDGTTTPRQALLIAINLTIIALGVAAAYRVSGWLGLFPLAINILYNLSNAIARNSGLRYLLPTDWVIYLYFGIGILQLSMMALALFGGKASVRDDLSTDRRITPVVTHGYSLKYMLTFATIFVFIGMSLIGVDRLIPHTYKSADRDMVFTNMLTSPGASTAGITEDSIAGLLNDPDYRFAWGAGMYPIYYSAGEGEERTAKTGYAPGDEARLILILVGTANSQIILNLSEPPGELGNGSTIVVLGCRKELHLQAAIVHYPETGKFLIDHQLFNGCS